MLFAIISTDSCTWNKHVTSIVFTDVNMGMIIIHHNTILIIHCINIIFVTMLYYAMY